jgi:type II secretory pathway pseudopilin PulG
MKRRSPPNNQQGFTLIELLIYVTIFATMIGAVVGLVVLATGQRVSSQVTAEVNYQGEAVMAYITQTIHQADSVTSPTRANSGGSLTLAMAGGSVNPTVFSSYNDGTTTRLRVSEGNPGTVTDLTNARVTVSSVSFANMSVSGSKGSILVRFTLSSRTSSQRQEFNYSKTFYGAASIP